MRIDMPIFPYEYTHESMEGLQSASDWYNIQGFHHRWYMSIVRHAVGGCEWAFTLYIPNVSPVVYMKEKLDEYALFYNAFQQIYLAHEKQYEKSIYFRSKKDTAQAMLSSSLVEFAAKNCPKPPVHIPIKEQVEIKSSVFKSHGFAEAGTFVHMHVIFNVFQVDYDTPLVDHLSL